MQENYTPEHEVRALEARTACKSGNQLKNEKNQKISVTTWRSDWRWGGEVKLPERVLNRDEGNLLPGDPKNVSAQAVE